MSYIVPQFIEKEPKIVGPLTFRQLIFIGTSVSIAIFLYFTIAKENFFLFIFLAALLVGAGLSLAFLKIEGFSLPQIIQNAFLFFLKPKRYIWQKKNIFPKVVKISKETKKEIAETEQSILKVSAKSRLWQLNKFLEIRTK